MTLRTQLGAVVVGLALLGSACASASTGANDIAAQEGEAPPVVTELGEPAESEFIKAGVDLSIADVPLTDVVFDTFDGGSVTLAEASEEQILGLLDAIPPIDDPVYEAGSETTQMNADDLVIGYVGDDGTAWAYPHRILNFHEIVNDEIGGLPVLISYCPLCRSGVVFDRRINDLRHDGVLSFGNSSALYENDLVLVDRETNSYWWQLAGRSIVGRLAGAELPVLPSVTTTWDQWITDHPDTQLLSHDQGFGRDYDRDPFATYADRVDAGQVPFPVGPDAFDDQRLGSSTRIVGFEVDVNGMPVPHAVPVLTNQATDVVVDADINLIVRLDGNGGGEALQINDDGVEVPYPSRSSFWFSFVAIHKPTQVVIARPE